MRKFGWCRWAVTIASGAFLMQTSACVELSTSVTAVATTVGAGGILFIVREILSG